MTCTIFNSRILAPLGRLVVTKDANKTQFRAPAQVRYVITARNTGRGIVRNARVCDRLPKGVVFVRAVPRATRVNGELCWRIARLRPGAKRSFRVEVRVVSVNSQQAYVNRVDIIGSNSINCRSRALTRRAQGRQQRNNVCVDSARIVVLPAPKPPPPPPVRFTG